MQKKQTWIRTATLAATVALMSSPAAAQSVGVYRGASGARDASIAGADSVLGATPVSALSWNPAGLASLEEPEFDLAFATLRARGKIHESRGQQRVAEQGERCRARRRRRIPVAAAVDRRRGWVADRWRDRRLVELPGRPGSGRCHVRARQTSLGRGRASADRGAWCASRFAIRRRWQRLDALEPQRAGGALHFPDAEAAGRFEDTARCQRDRNRLERQRRRDCQAASDGAGRRRLAFANHVDDEGAGDGRCLGTVCGPRRCCGLDVRILSGGEKLVPLDARRRRRVGRHTARARCRAARALGLARRVFVTPHHPHQRDQCRDQQPGGLRDHRGESCRSIGRISSFGAWGRNIPGVPRLCCAAVMPTARRPCPATR